MQKPFKIFVDFDGTITQTDVGEAMFLKFGDPIQAEKIIESWIDYKISSAASWQQLCDTVTKFDNTLFEDFLNTIEIFPGFKDFVDFCNYHGFPIIILSDGLDYYIKRILRRENLGEIPFYSNKLTFDSNNKLIPVFPYSDEECTRCANCKRNHIIENSGNYDFTVYIGDGYSDICPAQFCDFIFAKKSLLKYCETNRISYYPFKDFNEIMIRLEELNGRKRLRKRYQADLKRRGIYQQG